MLHLLLHFFLLSILFSSSVVYKYKSLSSRGYYNTPYVTPLVFPFHLASFLFNVFHSSPQTGYSARGIVSPSFFLPIDDG